MKSAAKFSQLDQPGCSYVRHIFPAVTANEV